MVTKLVRWVLQGSVDTLVRWGGQLSCHAMSNYVRNFGVKNYKNQTTSPQLIANNMSGCFFLKHGVHPHNCSMKRMTHYIIAHVDPLPALLCCLFPVYSFAWSFGWFNRLIEALCHIGATVSADITLPFAPQTLSLIHIWRCRRSYACRSRWSPYH